MRIAIFSDSYRPVINGAAVAVGLLAEELRRRHEVTIFAPAHPEVRGPEVGVERTPSYRLPRAPDYPIAFPLSPRIARRFALGAFDLVHTHSPFTLGQVGRWLARRHGLPLVTTYHTLYTEYLHYARPIPGAWLRPHVIALARGYCNGCAAVVVPTAPIQEVLQGYGVTAPIEVIPTGAVITAGAEDAGYLRNRYELPTDTVILLFAGRLAPEKNLPLLLRAFADLRARGAHRTHLFIAGGGPSEEALRRLAVELGIGVAVTFAGFLPRAELIRCYAGADLFAFPSTTDTQGLVILEAKSAGLPVVSVDAYGPAAVVRDGVDGFLVPDDPAPKRFADALMHLISDPKLRRRMGERAREDALRYSPAGMAARYEALYERVLSRPVSAVGPSATGEPPRTPP
jgi:1,2-diacylglycerol 3-alpha-glucosyltransferase